jgi:hypothetical protein
MFDHAEYLRAQALTCLGLAREMSDPKDKEPFKQEALTFTLRAERLEERKQLHERELAVGRWRGS